MHKKTASIKKQFTIHKDIPQYQYLNLIQIYFNIR
jgi:hypothetical protein